MKRYFIKQKDLQKYRCTLNINDHIVDIYVKKNGNPKLIFTDSLLLYSFYKLTNEKHRLYTKINSRQRVLKGLCLIRVL